MVGALCLAAGALLLCLGMRWGSTRQERARRLPGDEYFEGGAKARVEPDFARDPESGARDQYQCYEVLYAGGGSAGVAGKEHSARWRRRAIQDGVLDAGS